MKIFGYRVRRSRTLIVNAAVAALVALEAGVGLLQPFLPLNFYTIVAVGLPIINSVLRVITTQPLITKLE